MNKIESFKINHLELLPGIYVSRKDYLDNNVLTTFDLRMTAPNREPVMNTAEVHAIEHLGATFLRNKLENEVIYFGPMGCRTGFYLILLGDKKSEDIVDLIKEVFLFIKNFEGVIPGQSAKDCGNYSDMNLNMAKYYASKYLKVLNSITKQNLIYPE
ncbi:S-ribosylhomocysteine lyase [uncultured Finegoldia sp.]|uniref:S-ribosylhomocysteine lyase n=1 Tax=uncultured Finegoldia sp. TaxID=328009 RepID=UPI002606982D|nr:S-ribosylhomocysteine lyase [uncultured Finegoldia sp.]